VDLTYTDEQELLARSARQLLEQVSTSEEVRRAEQTPDGYPDKTWATAAELGWPGIALPAEWGGAGQGVLELAVLAEELGRAACTLPLLPSFAFGAVPLLAAGRAEQRARWLAGLAAGEVIAALAAAEPGGVDERDRPTLVATPSAGGGWRLSGTKLLVRFGHRAHLLLVTALVDGEPTVFAVDAGQSGVTAQRHRTLGPEPLAAVHLDDVAVGADDVVGEPGGGVAVVDRALDHASVLDAAYAVGVCDRALALAVEHTSQREQFGRPVGSYQAVAHRCVDMRTDIDAARVLVQQAAWRLDRWDDDPVAAARAVAIAGAYAREAAQRVVVHAHQVHGAIGFSSEYDLQLLTRRAKAFELSGGVAAHHRERVAVSLGL